MTSIPAHYYRTSPHPPGLRRSSISSTGSWESSDSSLPSTPGGNPFSHHAQQKQQSHSFTESLMMDEIEMDNSYASHSIAPKLLTIHQYPHPHPHHQHNHQHNHESVVEYDHEMSDDSASSNHSHSESGDSNSQAHSSYLRKGHSFDAGLDHRPPLYQFAIAADSTDICTSPQQINYNPARFHGQHPSADYSANYDQYGPASPCNEAALSTLKLSYYPSPGSPPHISSSGQQRRRPSKKPKSAGGLPLIVTSDDKPHICTIGSCDARFKRQEHLRRHERTHTAERPFSCEICDRRFSRTDNLRMHRKTHMKKTGRNVFVPGLADHE